MKKFRNFAPIILSPVHILASGGMKMKRGIWVIFPIFLGIFSGCTKAPTKQVRVVTEVVVESREERFCLTESQDMEQILDYLRLLQPGAPATEDPEQMPDQDYRITVYDSAGGQKQYFQRGERWFHAQGEPWRSLRENRRDLLGPLVEELKKRENF